MHSTILVVIIAQLFALYEFYLIFNKIINC